MNTNEQITELAEIITTALHGHGMESTRRVDYERGSATNGRSWKLLYRYTDERGIEQEGRVIARGASAAEILTFARGMLEALDTVRTLTR